MTVRAFRFQPNIYQIVWKKKEKRKSKTWFWTEKSYLREGCMTQTQHARDPLTLLIRLFRREVVTGKCRCYHKRSPRGSRAGRPARPAPRRQPSRSRPRSWGCGTLWWRCCPAARARPSRWRSTAASPLRNHNRQHPSSKRQGHATPRQARHTPRQGGHRVGLQTPRRVKIFFWKYSMSWFWKASSQERAKYFNFDTIHSFFI